MGRPVEYRIFPDFCQSRFIGNRLRFLWNTEYLQTFVETESVLSVFYKERSLFPVYIFAVMSGPVDPVYKSGGTPGFKWSDFIGS